MRSAPSQSAPRAALVLLVDDNEHGMLARRSILEEFGYTVVAVSNAPDAFAALEQHSIDLVVTDFKMEPVSGLELIRSVRGSFPELPVILLTGFADKLGLKPENTGATLVLQKSPNEHAALLRNARKLLQPGKKPSSSAKPKSRAQAAGH